MIDPVVIIGTGLAAYQLAKEWRTYDSTTPLLMITESTGVHYSKPLLSTALTQGKSPEQLTMATAEQAATQLHATILTNTTVTALDLENQTLVAGEQSYHYRDLILAIGAQPFIPPVLKTWPIHTINGWEDYWTFRAQMEQTRDLVILGGGLVGCEFANDFSQKNHSIQLVTGDSGLLPRLVPSFVSEALVKRFEAHGIQVSLNTPFDTLQFASSDLLLSACGLIPHTALAKSAGLQVDTGILVNAYLETSQKHVYALGDCAEIEGLVLQYVPPLMQSARALAKTLAGEPTRLQLPVLPVSVKTTLYPISCYLPPSYALSSVEPHVIQQEGLDFAIEWRAQGEKVGYVATGSLLKLRPTLQAGLPPLLTSH